MANQQNSYTGSQGTGTNNADFSFTFPSFTTSEVKVEVDNVVKTLTTHYTVENYNTTSGGKVRFTAGNIPTGTTPVRIFRQTDVDSAKATFTAGSSLKAAEINDNFKQVRHALQEAIGANATDRKVQEFNIEDDAITGAKLANNLDIPDGNKIRFGNSADLEVYHDGSHSYIKDTKANGVLYIDGTGTAIRKADGSETIAGFTADGSVDLYHNGSKKFETTAAGATVTGTLTADLADNSIDSEHYVNGSIDAEHIANLNITTAKLADDAVTKAKIADDSIDSEHYVDGSIDAAHIANLNITTAKLAADAVTNAKIADNSIDSEQYVDGSIDAIHIANGNITTAKIADSNVTTAKIADSNITTAKIATGAVTTQKIAADNITGSLIADDQIDSEHLIADSIDTEHYAPNSVDTTALASNAVTNAKIADNAIDSEHYTDGSIDTAHIANTQVTDAKLASNAVTTSKITDANVTTDKIANDAITIGKIGCEQTTISNSNLHLPTSGAVVDYVAAQIAPLGGLEVIATDAAFPNTQPQAGVVISIADAGGLVVNGSGTSTTGRTVGGSTVTINNINSQFNNTTVDNGVAMMVSSTGSGQIYNYHKATLKEADLLSLSGDINDFAERYRVSNSAPTSSLDEGDLWWDSATDKLKVYDGSSWEEVASSGDFYINTISSYSGTGGNSATFNGSAYRFVLSNPGSSAQQHVVSINGVIQKPNSGTSQPSEGFVIDGSSIIFSNPPASGSDYFILTLGTTVSIGTPSDGTVTTAKITSGAVTTAKIADDAVTGDKIATNLDLPDNNTIRFGTGNDLRIFHDGTDSYLRNETGELRVQADDFRVRNNANNQTQLYCNAGAQVELYYDNSKKFETTSDGVRVPVDSGKVSVGSTGNLFMYHTGTSGSAHGLLDNSYGVMYHLSPNFEFRQKSTNDTLMKLNGGGAVELYYDNSKKFETGQTGVTVVGDTVTTSKFRGNDNVKLSLGDSEDLQIYHNGSHSYIQDAGTGSLILVGNNVTMQNAAQTENMFSVTENAGVELFFDGAAKLETRAGDTIFHDDIRIQDNNKINIGTGDDLQLYHDGSHSYLKNSTGSLQFLDGASEKFRISGTGTSFKDDIFIANDGDKINLGASNDLQIYHDGSESWIKNDTGTLNILNDGTTQIKNNADNETIAQFVSNAECSLWYDSSKKFETQSGGAKVTGTLSVTGAIYTDNEFNMTAVGNKFIDTAHKDNTLHFRRINDGDGGHSTHCTVNSGGVWSADFNDTSDEKLKENITAISDGAISKVKQLRPVNFDWKETDKANNVSGFIAQEIKTVLPNLVYGTEYDPTIVDEKSQRIKSTGYSVNTIGIVAHLTKALQEAITKIETLETKVAALEAK